MVKAFVVFKYGLRLLDYHGRRIWIEIFGDDEIGATLVEESNSVKEKEGHERKLVLTIGQEKLKASEIILTSDTMKCTGETQPAACLAEINV